MIYLAEKLYGIIYMTSRQVNLSIINLHSLKVVESATSNFFDNRSYEYKHNIETITTSLNGFIHLLKDYGVKNYHFWANQQSLDAISARYLGEQIYIRTSLRVRWLNTSQLTYYKAVAVITHLDNFKKLSLASTFLLSLGSERVSLSHFNKQKFASTWNIDLGAVQIHEVSAALKPVTSNPVEVLDDYIGSKLEHLRHIFFGKRAPSSLIIQDATALNKRFIPQGKSYYALNSTEFDELYRKIISSSDQFLMDYFNVDENDVARIVPYFLLIHKIIKLINVKKIVVTNITVSDGLAIERADKIGISTSHLEEMIVTAAENIAGRYLTSKSHRENVSKIALHLFDQLKKIHHLGKRERLLLQVACIVADIGNYINQQGHYRHSAYILEANKLIGLSNEENQIIAEVSRYHSSESPESQQPHFQKLDPEVQMKVAKLAALLRLADALDDSREEKISKISVSLRNTEMIISAYSNQNLALEKWSFSNKADLFEEVFGIKPILKQRRQLK
ncbi:exopolyphosphatase [Liquorilactobacillus satsumensis]|uniref:exopolyphosphatase n=1 Tax=Liquorilactobacillus satsumensis TaxID=259059 RepID=UPI0021C41259|nr:exopolyphosphatase [Liquorilactobacillus satsumensis]